MFWKTGVAVLLAVLTGCGSQSAASRRADAGTTEWSPPSKALGPPSASSAPLPPEVAAAQGIPVRFHAFLPGSTDPKREGVYRLDLRIYRSPQGGEPLWQESREVEVRKGWIDILLGEKRPIPDSIHDLTFKFLGVSVNGRREVYPRAPIVNVVYISTEAALALETAGRGGPLPYRGSGRRVSPKTEAPATWRAALERARAAGGDLPDYEEWYAALHEAGPRERLERAGHYEWVLPWVYDTASHGLLNRYFRGRLQGCDYMDLSPENRYPYRIAFPEAASGRPVKEHPGIGTK